MRTNTRACFLSLLMLTTLAFAKTYDRIQVKGANSLGAESVIYYSKLKPGNISSYDLRQAILALHKSGLFADVKISESGKSLVITVVEQPVIAKIEFKGTDHMPQKQFIDALKAQGIAVGKVFNPQKVYQIKPMLLQALAALGYEQADVNVNFKQSSKKSIKLKISISEGDAQRITDISFVGNNNVASRILLSQMELTPHLWSFISDNNKYSKIAFAKDINAIEQYYRTKGYIQARASLAKIIKDKNGIKLVVNINEGPIYRLQSFALKGFIKHDYSRATKDLEMHTAYDVHNIEHVKNKLEHELGSLGYAFAKVEFKPVIVEKNLVRIEFTATPGQKVQIRRINFAGQGRTQDEVLRREMQQTEIAQYNYSLVRESERRLKNLEFIGSAVCKPEKHDGFTDLDCEVKEIPSATLVASIGYAAQSGVTYKVDLAQKNLVGSGKRLMVNLEKSDVQVSAQVSMTQPYIFGSKYSNTWSLDAVKLKNVKKDSAKYQSNHFGIYNDFSIPFSNHSFFSIGLGLKNVNIVSFDPGVDYIDEFIASHGKHFGILDAHFAVKYHDYDKTPFPENGTSRKMLFTTVIPYQENTVRYYKFDFTNSSFISLGHGYVANWLLQIGYGKGYDGDVYPFFNNYWAGGEGSVRGFDTNSLGPKDNKDKAMGGNILATTSLNLYLPQYFGDDMRYGLFVDAGNVFKDSVDLHEIRASIGAVLQWHTPLAPLTFSYGIPIVKKSGDKTEPFSVSMSTDL